MRTSSPTFGLLRRSENTQQLVGLGKWQIILGNSDSSEKLQSDSDLQRLLSCYHCSYLSQRRLSTFPLLSFIVCYYFVSCSLFGKFSNGICVLNTTDRYHGCVPCLIVLDWWTPQTIAWLLSICHWHIISDRFSLFVQQIKSTRLTPPWQIRPLQRVT